ncbi:MAG: META domain-containing protein [Chitinophagaceae bacterium]|nr:META domain-containing protein [Chitinophagaceae bacterium]
MKKYFLLLLSVIILSSCHSTKTVTTIKTETVPDIKKTDDRPSVNGSWELQKLWSSDTSWRVKPVLNIDLENNTFNGNTGCNAVSGKFVLKGLILTFNREMFTTKMACPGYKDNTFLNILLKVNTYILTKDILTLSQDEIALMVLKRKAGN